MPYRFLEDIASADCAVAIEAKSAESLFEEAALALVDAMVDHSEVRRAKSWNVSLKEDDLERLLYAWLSELVFIMDTENVLFSDSAVHISMFEESFDLQAEIRGEPIDLERHDIGVIVKAVTMHMFKIEELPDGWKAFVVFDL